MTSPQLSKSRLLSWQQCEKRLWLEVNRRDLAQTSVTTQHWFDVGNQVGRLAQLEYPNGILIDRGADMRAALRDTQTAIAGNPNRPVFEATFAHQDLLVRVDLRNVLIQPSTLAIRNPAGVMTKYSPLLVARFRFWISLTRRS